jgi:hypothetical protein
MEFKMSRSRLPIIPSCSLHPSKFSHYFSPFYAILFDCFSNAIKRHQGMLLGAGQLGTRKIWHWQKLFLMLCSVVLRLVQKRLVKNE